MAAIPVPPIVWALKKDVDLLKKQMKELQDDNASSRLQPGTIQAKVYNI